MREIQILSLVCMVMTAVLSDLGTGRIPNGIIAAGLLLGIACQVMRGGFLGAVIFLGGAALPLVLFGPFYYFRMIGAGDVKLLCAIGGFLGPAACFSCIVAAVFFGGAISLCIMLYSHSFWERMLGFFRFMQQYSETGQWTPYLEQTSGKDRFCFSVPVLLGILYCLGGGKI